MSSLTIAPNAFSARLQACPEVHPQVRLTRRGRLVVFLASLMLVLGTAFILLGGASVATDHAGTPEPTRIVMVGDGETLWGIAGSIAGDGDTRDMMTRIERLNALDTGMLYAGQRLRVPTD
jgi:hypothetical protein